MSTDTETFINMSRLSIQQIFMNTIAKGFVFLTFYDNPIGIPVYQNFIIMNKMYIQSEGMMLNRDRHNSNLQLQVYTLLSIFVVTCL